jgi:multidrug efflux pump subunit AcrB
VATGFLPTMDEGAFVLDFFLPPGTSLEETNRQASRIDRILATTKGIDTFTRRTGAEMGPAAATQQNRGDIIVRLSPRAQRAGVDAIVDQVRERAAAEVPEARVEFVQVLQDMLDDLSGNPRPVEVRIFGDDQRVLAAKAKEAASRIAGVPDLVDLFNGVEGEAPAFAAVVAPAAAAVLGVTPQALAADLGVVLAGRIAGRIRIGDRAIGIRVRMPDEVRFNPERLAPMPLAYGASGAVPLGAVATLSRPIGPTVLKRENQRPVVILDAGIRGGDVGGVADEVARRLADLPLDPGYQLEIGGQAEGARQTQLDLARVFGIGIVLVLGILILQLRSLRMALVVLLGAPLALVGAVTTLLVTGIPLNASSLMGCVLLAGLVVKNGILLLEHAEHQLDAGASMSDALVAAGERRLRPILMTTAATIAGLLPLAFAWGAGSELQRPLAVATIGGLILSTLVTLFAVPALAAALNPRRKAQVTTS